MHPVLFQLRPAPRPSPFTVKVLCLEICILFAPSLRLTSRRTFSSRSPYLTMVYTLPPDCSGSPSWGLFTGHLLAEVTTLWFPQGFSPDLRGTQGSQELSLINLVTPCSKHSISCLLDEGSAWYSGTLSITEYDTQGHSVRVCGRKGGRRALLAIL